jgi:site-specific DNA-methyltransferase (adenine-specific)
VSIDLRHGEYQRVLADVTCDALIVDAPYSDRTHSTYRDMPSLRRRAIGYACWSERDVRDFVEYWEPRTRGWFCSITDDGLAPAWKDALARAGRYTFSPLACLEPGKTVRLTGDGPAQWSTWLVVARPRSRAMAGWGSLPGGYIAEGRAREVPGPMGGKPLGLMRAIIRDYSRPGDLVCDPCAGGATTLIAAHMEGRRSIGSERSYATAELAAARIEKHLRQQPLFAPAVEPVQEGLAL